jgi:predicted aspartyl protease
MQRFSVGRLQVCLALMASFAVAGFLLAGWVRAQDPPTAAGISQHVPLPMRASDCFELRDELLKKSGRKQTPAMVQAIVDTAFNHAVEAQKEFLAVIRLHSDPDAVTSAHGQLAYLYERFGHARQALVHNAQGADAKRKPMSGLLEALAKYPQQTVAARGFSHLEFTQTDDGVLIPVSVNGKTARFIVDTGAAISALSESQARSLAVTIHDDHFSVQDFTGKDFKCRVGIANEIAAGKFLLRHVPFCVIPDRPPERATEAPLGDASPGVLGLPVLLAFETIRWSFKEGTREGNFEIGFPSTRRNLAQSNVCFAGAGLVARAELGDRNLALDFDTGNDQTMLYPAFAGDFAEVMKTAGPKKPHALQGLGESIAIDSVELPELKLKLAGLDVMIQKVSVFLEPAPSPSPCLGCYGIAGRDLLNQARSVTLDFNAMKLVLGR